ncbi:protein prune homolog 2-like [Amphibalanus amphitrite]|uniref:protein prune homolog 2-like n=1 Tax=Amphibalanus amphitrite TaxID=1232801 RepID=UPI001C921F10|nr:protein prune homolog 2-like [Amphibalanus amphitrite]
MDGNFEISDAALLHDEGFEHLNESAQRIKDLNAFQQDSDCHSSAMGQNMEERGDEVLRTELMDEGYSKHEADHDPVRSPLSILEQQTLDEKKDIEQSQQSPGHIDVKEFNFQRDLDGMHSSLKDEVEALVEASNVGIVLDGTGEPATASTDLSPIMRSQEVVNTPHTEKESGSDIDFETIGHELVSANPAFDDSDDIAQERRKEPMHNESLQTELDDLRTLMMKPEQLDLGQLPPAIDGSVQDDQQDKLSVDQDILEDPDGDEDEVKSNNGFAAQTISANTFNQVETAPVVTEDAAGQHSEVLSLETADEELRSEHTTPSLLQNAPFNPIANTSENDYDLVQAEELEETIQEAKSVAKPSNVGDSPTSSLVSLPVVQETAVSASVEGTLSSEPTRDTSKSEMVESLGESSKETSHESHFESPLHEERPTNADSVDEKVSISNDDEGPAEVEMSSKMFSYDFDGVIPSQIKAHVESQEPEAKESTPELNTGERAADSQNEGPVDDIPLTETELAPYETSTDKPADVPTDQPDDNMEALLRANDVSKQTVSSDLHEQSEKQSTENFDSTMVYGDTSHVVKRDMENHAVPEEHTFSLDQSIAPSWSGQIIPGDNPSEGWNSDNEYYEGFRLRPADQDTGSHRQETVHQPVDVKQSNTESREEKHNPDASPSVDNPSEKRLEADEDVVAVTTRMTTLEAEKGRVLMTDVSSLLDAGAAERPESSAFGTPPEDMAIRPTSTPTPEPRTASRNGSVPRDVDLGNGEAQLEKGRVTPETLAADEEQDDQFEDGAELEYDETIGQGDWRTCVVAGKEQKIDMSIIEPYTKVLSHGGYMEGDAGQSIIVFAACHLPERSRPDYGYVMDNLFLYVLTTLDELVSEEYVLVYLHGGASAASSPTFSWLRRAYQLVDRRLRKTLKGLYLVHPSFWLRTIVALTRPFISSKFSRKLRYVDGLRELSDLIPMNHVMIPEEVKQVDFQLMIAERKRELNIK